MIYIEQRIEDLEKRISLIELKLKISEPAEVNDTIYSPSINLMSLPDPDTSFINYKDEIYPPYPEIIGSWDQN
jgi:hypothetical protein